MAGNISDQTTCLSNLSLTDRFSANTLTTRSGIIAGAGVLDLRTNTVVASLDTRADATSMTIGQLRLVFQASGISLVYSSGNSVYVVGQSSQSAAQA